MNDTLVRILRTLLQLVAGGALTGLVDQVVADVPASYAPYIALGFTFLVASAQNIGEELGLFVERRGGGDIVLD